MREPEQWRVKVAESLRVPFWTVDADVIVPTKLLLKEQFGARTIRPRIHALLPQFLVRQKNVKAKCPGCRRHACSRSHRTKTSCPDGSWIVQSRRPRAGTAGATAVCERFASSWTSAWPTIRRRVIIPNKTAPAGYLRIFISGSWVRSRLPLRCKRSDAPARAKDAFLEQVIVRRELAINFRALQFVLRLHGVSGTMGVAFVV